MDVAHWMENVTGRAQQDLRAHSKLPAQLGQQAQKVDEDRAASRATATQRALALPSPAHSCGPPAAKVCYCCLSSAAGSVPFAEPSVLLYAGVLFWLSASAHWACHDLRVVRRLRTQRRRRPLTTKAEEEELSGAIV